MKCSPKILLLLCLLALINGIIGFGELYEAPYRNDGALHLHQIQRLDAAYTAGQSLLDHWDPIIGLGYPFPRTYSLLSHLLVWGSSQLTAGAGSFVFFYGFWTWLLWLVWPLSSFAGAKLLGLQSDQALGAALASMLMHTEFRFGIAPETYFWLGYGLLPNLLGLVLFPLAIGFGVRFLKLGKGLFPALAFLAATWFSHLIMGYVASFSIAIATLVLLRTSGLRVVGMRLLTLGVLCLTTCAFFLYPYFLEGPLINHTAWEPDHYWDSYGAHKVLLALISGHLLDYKMMFPVLSLLTALGLWRIQREQNATSLSAVLAGFWLCAFLGRSVWNPASWVLFFNDHVPFERFLVPSQWFLSMIAGIGLAYGFRKLTDKSLPPWLAITVCFFPLAPHIARNIYQHPVKAKTFKAEINQDFQALSTRLSKTLPLLRAQQNGGRLFVPHDRQVKFRSVAYNQIPLDANLPHVGALWHSMSLNSEYLGSVNPAQESHLNLFAIKFALAPRDYWPKAAMRALNTDADFTLYSNPRYDGLFTMGRLGDELLEPGEQRTAQIHQWLASDALDEGRYLYQSPNQLNPSSTNPGVDPRQGFYKSGLQISEAGQTRLSLKMQNQHAGWLIGRFTYHPGWQVAVDGQKQEPIMVSPSYPAVFLEPGNHEIVFTYVPHGWTKPLFFLALATLALMASRPIWRRFFKSG